jgi:hypothetical protein
MVKSSVYTIDLNDFRAKGSKIFTGRDCGEQDRKASKIDALTTQFDKIELLIPEDIYSINPSYLEEFLVNVVLQLGKDGFLKKFTIINNGPYKITRDLHEAIDRILRENHALI